MVNERKEDLVGKKIKFIYIVDGRTLLEWTLKSNAGNWVDSAQGRNYWRALVNAALNLRVP